MDVDGEIKCGPCGVILIHRESKTIPHPCSRSVQDDIVSPRRLSQPGQPGIFMKVLSQQLFHESSPFTKENSLLIDDSRKKSVCNESGNAIFLKPWTHEDQNDNVLLGRLLPWLESLHNGCPTGQLREYVNANRIGLGPPTRDDDLVQKMMADEGVCQRKGCLI